MQENERLDSEKQEEYLWVATFLPLRVGNICVCGMV
jgi:hypothetical protein